MSELKRTCGATPLNAKQLKAAQQALRYSQAIDEILFEAGLGEYARELEGVWKSLVRAVTITLRHSPALGSTLLPTTNAKDKRGANPST